MALACSGSRVRCCVACSVMLLSASRAAATDLRELVKKVEPAVVRIDAGRAIGSGVVIDDRGLVFTNFHVVAGAKSAKITLRSGDAREAKGFVKYDQGRDLVLLKIEPLPNPVALKLASGLPETGLAVAAFGNPLGFSFTASEGIVSAVRKGDEIRQIIGDIAYRELGYGSEATWVQTTTPISGGNSGGPLVNLQGEVLGLNTWVSTSGQNVNFAISSLDMSAVLSGAGDAVHKLAELPKIAAPLDMLDDPNRAEEFKVALPSGRIFTFGVFFGGVVRNLSARSDEGNLAVVSHPGGAPFAVAQHNKGVLDGRTVAQYDNSKRMMQLTYAGGKRHGVLRSWDEAGNPLLFAQYAKGKRHGFCCVFDADDSWMLIEYTQDQPSWIQVFAGYRVLEGFKSRELAEKNAHAGKLLARADKAEETLKGNEIAFRKGVSDFERELRKARAVQLGPAKRDQIQARANARAAQDSAFVQELYRKFYGR